MTLYGKLRDAIASLADTDVVNLEDIFVEPFSPPPSLRKEIVPMDCCVTDASSRSEDAASSAAHSDDKPGFAAEKFIDLVIYHLYEQKVNFSTKTWRKITKFYEEADFGDRCGSQIPLETVFIICKADADEMFRRKDTGINLTRDKLFEMFLGEFIGSVLRKDPLYAVQFAEQNLLTKIKTFLQQESIVSAFQYCLTQVLFGEQEEKPAKKPKRDLNVEKREVDKQWILQHVDAMKIYVVGSLAPLKGVTLTDGILLNIGAVVDQLRSTARHDADLFGLSCHETAHFLIRAFVSNYNWNTPTKDCHGEPTVFRFDKNTAGERKGLEMGRYLETELFGGVQPNWTRSNEMAATAFLQRSAGRSSCPPPLIDAAEHEQLGVWPRPASYSFAGEFITEEIFLE